MGRIAFGCGRGRTIIPTAADEEEEVGEEGGLGGGGGGGVCVCGRMGVVGGGIGCCRDAGGSQSEGPSISFPLYLTAGERDAALSPSD